MKTGVTEELYRNEIVLQPVVIFDRIVDGRFLAFHGDSGRASIGKLRRRVVTPDDHVLHCIGRCFQFQSDLCCGTVMIYAEDTDNE